MKRYRFWLDKLNPATREMLIRDPDVIKVYLIKDPVKTQFYHGDWIDTGRFNINRPVQEISNLEPTAVEVDDSWKDLAWLLLQVSLTTKNPPRIE